MKVRLVKNRCINDFAVIYDTETTRINDFAVIYDTENRIIGNGEKWLQPLKLAGVVAIFLFKISGTA